MCSNFLAAVQGAPVAEGTGGEVGCVALHIPVSQTLDFVRHKYC